MRFSIAAVNFHGKEVFLLGIKDKGFKKFFFEFDTHEQAYAVMLHYRYWLGTGKTVDENFYAFNEETHE